MIHSCVDILDVKNLRIWSCVEHANYRDTVAQSTRRRTGNITNTSAKRAWWNQQNSIATLESPIAAYLYVDCEKGLSF